VRLCGKKQRNAFSPDLDKGVAWPDRKNRGSFTENQPVLRTDFLFGYSLPRGKIAQPRGA
jgi:hypothetical protein